MPKPAKIRFYIDCERPRSSKTKQPPNGHRQGKFDVEHKGTNKDLDNDIKQLKERLEDLLIELYNSPKTMGDHGIKARELSSELRNWKGSLDKEMEFSLLDRIVEEYEAEVAGQKPKRWFWK